MATKKQELEIPRGHPVLDVVSEITKKGDVKTGYLAGKALRGVLPNLMCLAARDIAVTGGELNWQDIDPRIAGRRLDSLVSQDSVVEIIAEVAHGISFQGDQNFMTVFLTDTLPKILAISSLTRSENHPEAFAKGLTTMARQTGEGTIKIQQPLCPPYNIKLNERGLLSHADGSLRSTLGSGFMSTRIALGSTFRRVVDKGVNVDFEFITYSGNKGTDGLVEIGRDVLDHYKGREGDMLTAIQSAFDELTSTIRIHFEDKGFKASATSIEETVAPAILAMKDDFIARFRKGNVGGRKFFVTDDNSAMDDWLRHNLDVKDTGALIKFEEEEVKYRRKQGISLDETVTTSAFMELALYRQLQKKARGEGRLVLSAETTADYQMAIVPHVAEETPAIIMGKPRDTKNLSNPLSIRQPFNQIERTYK